MRCFCITLPETPERTEKAKAHFKERSVRVEFFNGINAEVAGLSTIHPYEIDAPGSGYRMGFKPTGIWISHWALINALTLLQDEHFMILEIDVQFVENWHFRLDQALKDVPSDFDVLYVGSCCTTGRPTKHIKGEIYECKYPMCSHAYIVARKCLPAILSMRKCWAPWDIGLTFEVFPRLKVFTILPTCATQFDTELIP